MSGHIQDGHQNFFVFQIFFKVVYIWLTVILYKKILGLKIENGRKIQYG
jgi:hypothetical protein